MILQVPPKPTRKRRCNSAKAVTADALTLKKASVPRVSIKTPVAPAAFFNGLPVTDAKPQLASQFLFVTGAAGSGKTFLLRKQIENNPLWGKLTATTGAAARVLGHDVQTINAALRVFDLESLQIARDNGYLTRNLRYLHKLYERIVIDEASMMSRPFFEIVYAACKDEDIGLVISGDFLQLAPVTMNNTKPEWLFDSPLFQEFDVLKLNTQYRQTNKDFVTALNSLRSGDGASAREPLEKAGVNFWDIDQTNADDWAVYLAHEFQGTILVATNARKNGINSKRYRKLLTPEVVFKTQRVGQWTKAELERWKDIPDFVSLKVGARVMVLKNAYDENDRLIFANGDTGIVQEINNFGVEVLRDDGQILLIQMVRDDNGIRHTVRDADGTKKVYLHRAPTAEIVFMPLAQAWATTVHKAQGLTFNHPVCVDIFGNEQAGGNFFGHPAMLYVAVSRVRNPKDLTIVGANSLSQSQSGLTLLEANCNMDGKCRKWL